MTSPARPALRYLGGKWKLAARIIAEFPPHRLYVEPFGGAASVLVQKPRAKAEVYNDLDGEVVNYFRVLRDPELASELCRLVALTPFAREEFDGAYEPAADPVEAARRLIVRSFMGHGSSALGRARKTGFRIKRHKAEGTTSASDWVTLPEGLAHIARRFSGVAIEHRPALQVIDSLDDIDVLFYVDPPYVESTRSGKRLGAERYHAYAHELTDGDHEALLDRLLTVRGMVVLSGYAHPIYEDRLGLWRRIEMATHADGARPRTEILWVNPAADAAHGLFGRVA